MDGSVNNDAECVKAEKKKKRTQYLMSPIEISRNGKLSFRSSSAGSWKEGADGEGRTAEGCVLESFGDGGYVCCPESGNGFTCMYTAQHLSH